MALLVLCSTLSLTIEKHYCGGVLIDVAVFNDLQKCKMETEEIALEQITHKKCCVDEVQFLEGQDELKISDFDNLDFDTQLFLTTFSVSYVNLFEGLPQHVIPHKHYTVPKLIEDRQVLDQVFLI
ncbi:MAG: hypothetical protein HRT67_03745 [Flavobacteriaceae bacterium]|nr:hypothetical protein [Flavobacteriaceae bacterium]